MTLLPLLAAVTVASMVLAAYAVVRGRDLVYSSAALALLGLFNAAMAAIMGYTIVAAFLVVVYVGAAVMFIIIAVSMLGGRSLERMEHERGLFAGATLAAVLLIIAFTWGAYAGFTRPAGVSIGELSSRLLSDYGLVLAILFVALAGGHSHSEEGVKGGHASC